VRRTAGGKVVWCEQQVPAEVAAAMRAAANATEPVPEIAPAGV
jgi:hypothetical protein